MARAAHGGGRGWVFESPPSALIPVAVQLRLVAGARRAIPRRIHGVRLAITAMARSDRRIPAELLEERLKFGKGPKQLDVADERPGEDELNRPVAEQLVGQARSPQEAYDVSGTPLTIRIPDATNTEFGAVACRSDGELSLDALTRQLIRERYEFHFVTTPDGGEALALEREVQRGALSAGSPPSTLCSRAGGLLPNRPNRPQGCRTSGQMVAPDTRRTLWFSWS